jgi:hypothetical protein
LKRQLPLPDATYSNLILRILFLNKFVIPISHQITPPFYATNKLRAKTAWIRVDVTVACRYFDECDEHLCIHTEPLILLNKNQ